VRNCPVTRAELSPLSHSYSFSGLWKNMTEPILPLGADVWDLDRLRLPAERVGILETRRRPPRHLPGDPFIKGPVSHASIASACRLPGSGLQVAMAYRFLCCRFRWENRWAFDAVADGLRITSPSAGRGINSAELAGLLAVEREPGCKVVVSILEFRVSERRPLYGPIPWRWWLPASLLPGRSPQVASVCWLSAGRSRSADFELALDGWAEFGLSRFSASRALVELERAGLVSVGRTPGGSPVVTILDATATNC
jgi:hypothetical protein